jgi:hypothetical protein
MQRDARLLKGKAVSSLRRCARAFNDFDDDGRTTTVLLHLQHAFEMLLKAALVESKVRLFDKAKGRSISFEKCVRLAPEHLRLTDAQCGLLRAIDAVRDDEQHYFGDLSEGLLYAHIRGGVTLFADLLDSAFGEKLADHLPTRVLPISTDPPADIDVLIDEQYEQIKKLLGPGTRRRTEARANIRALLAMEAHVAEDVLVTEKDVNRVERAIKGGKKLPEVFPRLQDITTVMEGTGVNLTVRFSKREGAPVRFVAADDPREAAAVREVDLERKYHISARELAERLDLSQPRALALRRHLSLDENEDYRHEFVFDSQRIPRYSDAALQHMREALDTADMEQVWHTHRPRKKTPAR